MNYKLIKSPSNGIWVFIDGKHKKTIPVRYLTDFEKLKDKLDYNKKRLFSAERELFENLAANFLIQNFKDLGIVPEVTHFAGKSIRVEEILNVPIKVFGFKIEPSKKKLNSDYLTIQIEVDERKRVIFTGATILIQTIQKVPKDKFPFNTIIVKKNEYLEFT